MNINVQNLTEPLSIVDGEKWKLGNILHFAAMCGSIRIFDELSKWMEKAQLEIEDINRIVCLKNHYEETIWHCAVSCNSNFRESLLRIWAHYNDKLEPKSEDDKMGILNELWTWCKDAKITVNQLEKLSLEKDRFGYTVWHLVLSYNNTTMAKELTALIRNEIEINTREYFAQLMISHGQTLWISATSTGDIETLHII
ncbi:hypothetical protein QE152_g5540 [Popillia japonica]|uniref:Ankyrin repeat protein n=1 Tax=Popillia japonica TaxID=7064 RepID=A0AAW1MMA2_POPJA